MIKLFLQIVFILHISSPWLLGQELSSDSSVTIIKDIDPGLQAQLKEKGQRMLQIYLIRHAKPDLEKKFLCSSVQAQNYIINYNKVPIKDFDSALVRINLHKSHQIYCSSLPRSQETALKLFGDSYCIISDSVFREFELKIINVTSLVNLPLDLWKGLSRVSWFMGFNHEGIESYKKAKKRAALAVKNLENLANQEETAILVGHGMINAVIAKELKKRGWRFVQKKGHVNLGATLMQKLVVVE